MDAIERIRTHYLNDISKFNIIYTCLLVATGSLESSTFFKLAYLVEHTKMSFANVSKFFTKEVSMLDYVESSTNLNEYPHRRPNLLARMSTRLGVYLDYLASYMASQFNEYTATSIVSCGALIIVISIICCFIMSLMREEDRRIKEQYKKLGTGSSQSFIAIEGGRRQNGNNNCGASQRAANISMGSNGAYQRSNFAHFQTSRYQKIIDQQSSLESAADSSPPPADPPSSSSISSTTHLLQSHQRTSSPNASKRRPNSRLDGRRVDCRNNNINQQQQQQQQQHHQHHHHHHHHTKSSDKVRLHELRRETYFGLVRLSRPGCRTVVLLCDAQSRVKLLRKFHQCIYPYRKNKSLQFAFLLIERNIGWYEDLLKSVLSERCPEGFRINPINCIGTVLVLNGFKKFFSVYHASNSRPSSDEEPPSLLLEETLLDNLPKWLERVFLGKVNRYYVETWPDRVHHLY